MLVNTQHPPRGEGRNASGEKKPMYKVNSKVITEDDIGRELQYHPADTQEAATALAIEALIIAELLKQRAEKLDINVDEKEVFVDQLIAREVEYPEASQSDCEHYFSKNQQKFRSSPLLEVKHILLASAPDDVTGRSESNELANTIIAQLQQAPESFAQLAKVYSRCPSAEVGGQLGQISCGQTVPEFERQLFNCSVGLVEKPLESRYGVHVIYIHRREEARQLPYEQVADKITDYLNTKVRNTAIAQYIATLIDAATIEGFEFDTENRQFFH